MTPTLLIVLCARYYGHRWYGHRWYGHRVSSRWQHAAKAKPSAAAAKYAHKPQAAKPLALKASDVKNPEDAKKANVLETLGRSLKAVIGASSPAARPATDGTIPVKLAEAAPKLSPEATRCSVDAADMEPAKVLRLLSRQTGINLILLGSTDAKVTIRLSDVPLIDVIKHLSAMTGMSYLKVGDAFVVGTPERLTAAYPTEWKAAKAEPPAPAAPVVEIATDTYRTNFVSAAGIATALGSLFKEIQVIAGPASTSPIVASLDGSKATGSQANALEAQDATAGARTVVLQGPRPIVERALAFAKRLDSPRAQVVVSVTVHDISNDALKDLGITWDFGSFTISEKPSGFNVGKITRTGLSVSAAITALESRNGAKLLASPSISMLDGERGFVLIGDRINFPVLTGYTQNNAPIFDIKEERVGIYLQVATTVASDGTVTLSLYPQVSTVTGYLQVNGASYPQISTREAQTTVRVGSGESIVLGGLIRDEDINLVEKVPILSSVPFLGELFKHRKLTHSSSQVILTVTPTIIVPEPRK